VACGNPAGLRISGALTISVWVRTYPKVKNRYVLSKHGWNIYVDGAAFPHLETRHSSNKRWIDLAATKPLAADQWNLITVVYDPSSL